MRKATESDHYLVIGNNISIPAFREEGDVGNSGKFFIYSEFQSPPSVRKATEIVKVAKSTYGISIPAFREEGDLIYH